MKLEFEKLANKNNFKMRLTGFKRIFMRFLNSCIALKPCIHLIFVFQIVVDLACHVTNVGGHRFINYVFHSFS